MNFNKLIGKQVQIRTKLVQRETGERENGGFAIVELAGVEPSGIWIKLPPIVSLSDKRESKINTNNVILFFIN